MLAEHVGGNQYALKAETDNPWLLGAIIVSLHASGFSGTNKVFVDLKDFPWKELTLEEAIRPRAFKFQCANTGCKTNKSVQYEESLLALSARAIQFHTLHEGHAFDIWLDNTLVYKVLPEGAPIPPELTPKR